MTNTTIKISSIIQNQLPEFVKEEFPLVSDFLKQYYLSVESQGSPYDLIQNLSEYVKLDINSNTVENTVLTSDIGFSDSTINVESTAGFPDRYGLFQINSEIITYTSKTPTSFEGCVRGFSGITSVRNSYKTDELVFSSSLSDTHLSGDLVKNLSILFLQEFFSKIKKQVAPGFENKNLFSDLNELLFVKQSKDFYSTKGTDGSFEILFRALYGKDVEVIKPRDYLIKPSDADYRQTKDLVVEKIEGNIEDLIDVTIYQDQIDNIPSARATVSNVEKFTRGEKDYYQVSLDFGYQKDIDVEGTVSGKFTVHPKTKSITEITDINPSRSVFVPSSSTIDVDSTVGFANSGEIVVDLENGTQLLIKYQSKTLNQLLDCTGITQPIPAGTTIKQNVFAYGETKSGLVKFFITGVLSELNIDKTYFQKENYPIKIQTLGKKLKSVRDNNWFLNIATSYDVRSVVLKDSSDAGTYDLNFYDPHSFVVGDFARLLSPSREYKVVVTSFNNERSVSVRSEDEIDENLIYKAEKILSRVSSINYPELRKFTTNVQNTYTDGENTYITSPSLPTYFNQPLKIQDVSVKFSGNFSSAILDVGVHSFYTGDSVYFTAGSNSTHGVESGFYFVKRITSTQISLSRSKPDIVYDRFITFNGKSDGDEVQLGYFYDKLLEPQKLIRKLSDPQDQSDKKQTDPGMVGIFVNGVEILNYKSQDSIYHGPIESIDVLSSGSGYDIINPPILEISDNVGSGATSYVSVTGQLEKINIIDGGFNYVNDPIVEISGGNGSGAFAKANLISYDHSVDFDSSSSAFVSLVKNTITLPVDHKFRDSEVLIYDSKGKKSIGGLSSGGRYYVSVQSERIIKLHKNQQDSASRRNAISLDSFGVGTHEFKCEEKKKRIQSISVDSKGKNYSNKRRSTTSSGINTSSNTITIENHGYSTGEILTYETTGLEVSGLSTNSKYYATVLDSNNFKLSSVGVGSVPQRFYYDYNQFVNFKSQGSGLHIFNYEPINVSIVGEVGVSTFSFSDSLAKVQPIFRGSIDSVFVENGGTEYGSQEILSYSRQPRFNLRNGSSAILNPVVSNGRIVDVLINSPGSGYNSPPDLNINGSGFGAVLTPIVHNGIIVSVNIISSGANYDKNTSIDVIPAGSGAEFNANISSWKINTVERSIQSNRITDDDGFVSVGLNKFGLQYSHPYAARKLRSSVFGVKNRSGEIVYTSDLIFVNGSEQTSDSHSPIIGWAYDGNPIYGPYGYSTPTGGRIRSMISGYRLNLRPNRPSVDIYPPGFFVEDYTYYGDGDLDEHNGRYCITPDYPNGVYAYFASVNTTIDTIGPFKNYRRPVFPYLIGNTYKSKPIDYNFSLFSNQDIIDFNKTGWLKNTTRYNFTNKNSNYDFVLEPYKEKEQKSLIRSISTGKLSTIKIEDGGSNYKVGDRVIFEDTSLDSIPPKASVSFVTGKNIVSISASTYSISNAELYKFGQQYVAISSVPHNLKNYDRVLFSTNNEFNYSSYAQFIPNKLTLNAGIDSTSNTGIVTYFSVSGSISNIKIRENDIYSIGEEQIKVLNIDPLSSRIRVLRNQNGTVGLTSYSSGKRLIELPRKLYLKFDPQTKYDFNRSNKQYYFIPRETVGLGVTYGVGISSTLFFSNPGAGITQITVPTRSLYIPSHNFENGDAVTYSSGGGSPISISIDGITSTPLQENSVLFVTKLSKDFIGLSTVQVGLNSIGEYVGFGTNTGTLLYFVGVGTGEVHSLTTNYPDLITGDIFKNEVTVSTSSTHGLTLSDSVYIDIKSGITTTVNVKYNDYNRRMILSPRSFIASDVDILTNTITIPNHGYYDGQKIIHTSSSPCDGLENEEIYKVLVVDYNKIKLTNINYILGSSTNIVDINSTSFGEILPINPPINITENQTIVFDLSDSSLSFNNQSVNYSAFELNFYRDENFKNKFTFLNSSEVEITKSGKVGITTDAKVTLKVYDSTPKILYYSLDPVNVSFSPEVKKSIIIDSDFTSNNKISIDKSSYNGKQLVSGITSTSFKFVTDQRISEFQYNSVNSKISYYTDSPTSFGGIKDLKVSYFGKDLRSLPRVQTVNSILGTGAVLRLESDSIGSVLSTEIKDIGFGYPSDFTFRPSVKGVSLFKVSPQSSFESIGIASAGRNYSTNPNLIVIDGLTKKVVTDVELNYSLGSGKVDIIKNTEGINKETPTIIPINNSNGLGISSIRFKPESKDVVVSFGRSFSDPVDFPFNVGDKVLIESTSVGINSVGKGFNSSNYNYTLFTVTSTDPNIGGIGATLSYNISEFLGVGETTGIFDPNLSSGIIVPQKHFPIFDIKLQKNQFLNDELILSKNSTGLIVDWDDELNILKVSSIEDFEVGDLILGQSSRNKAIIEDIVENNGSYFVDSGSIVENNWKRETGFLNNSFQRVHDNDYYQYFSYDLKSQISYDTWGEDIFKLNHTSGFKEFSNLVIESSDLLSGISTSQDQGDFTGIADFSRFIDLNCFVDFDLVRENNIVIDDSINSNEIYFNSRVLQDYIESIGNRVLMIDDFSEEFNDQPRSTRFSIVDTFNINQSRSVKYLTLVRDRDFTSQAQSLLISLIHDGSNSYINQYGRCETYSDLGFFDFTVFGTNGNLIFYPRNYSINDYDISSVSFDLRDTISGVGSTSLGDSIFVGSATTTISVGAATTVTIAGISSTYRSSKILVQIGATDSSYYQFDELTLIHDGSNVYLQDYGQLTSTSAETYSSSGIGTYYAYYSGSDVNVDLITNSSISVPHDVNSVRISIANTTLTGVGTEIFNTSEISSHYTSIPASVSPGITTIANFSSDYRGSYCIVSVEDLTNNQYQVSEITVCLNDSTLESFVSEFGVIETNSSIGLIGSTVTSGGNVSLTFTPNPSTEVQVRVYQNTIGIINDNIDERTIDFTNAYIRTGNGTYTGTDSDIRRSFNLTHEDKPIFERYFDASSSDVVDITNDTITMAEHFFVTGEEVKYNIISSGLSTERISIASTNIPGVGVTDKMPGTVYIVKVDDSKVQLAASASDALKSSPNILDLTSVGIGTSHRFISTNQNSKVLISIDNLILSPIVSTSVTTICTNNIAQVTDRLNFVGINSFFGGDLIKIDNEVMRIIGVGVGATNTVHVRRGWMGTGISTHSPGSLVVKVNGDYNIVDNTINFIEAPYGLKPISSTTNQPDERDWIGIQTHSTFSGRSFIRSGIENSSDKAYSTNYIFDDVSNQFNGITTQFTLKSSGSDIAGFSTSNSVVLINNIFQGPSRPGAVEIVGGYDLNENSGVTSITFIGSGSSLSYDINSSSVPRGGIIISVGSTEGFGYQPLVSAGGTAIVSISGTIQSISIGNSGSGYRPGVQSVVNVGVGTSSLRTPNIEFIGTAAISGGHIVSVAITNPGSGYTSTNPPYVFFDDPLSYSNLPLVYSSESNPGIGTEAKVDVVVGQGSSVINFELRNLGYGYGQGDILTVSIGGTVGIPTNTSLPFKEFKIFVDKTSTDKFSGWTFGDLQVIDPIDELFNGVRVDFPIKINGDQTTIKSRSGSNIDIKANLLILINDVLQIPDVSYSFIGGSVIIFKEAPKRGDTSKILFYKGTGDVDTQNIDILELVEEGDILKINKGSTEDLYQNPRIVYEIISTDVVKTNVYPGPGISETFDLLRPVTLCRQTEDRIINGLEVSKSRIQYEPIINPNTNIIENIGTASTIVYVESVKTFFDSHDEYLHDGSSEKPQNKIVIISQENISSAEVESVVSSSGTISSITIINGGVGYSTAPNIIIENPIGLGVTQRATATSTISIGGTVSSVSIVNPGTGYTTTNPPVVLVEPPTSKIEVIDNVSYNGDFGKVVGFGTTTISGTDYNIFDLYIPLDSYLRDSNIVGTSITMSQLEVGDFFVIKNSNIGLAVTQFNTYRNDNSVIGISTQFLDGIYQVSFVQTNLAFSGVGNTYLTRIFAKSDLTSGIGSFVGLSTISVSFDSTLYTFDSTEYTFDRSFVFYGEYTWGKITTTNRSDSKQFDSLGFSGIESSPTVIRFNPLKYNNYVN